MTENDKPPPPRTAAEMGSHGRRRLWYWGQRLSRLVELNAPDVILAHAAAVLFQAACGYLPAAMGAELTKVWLDHCRGYVGTCLTPGCGAERSPDCPDLCQRCYDQSLADIAAAEAELARHEREERRAKK